MTQFNYEGDRLAHLSQNGRVAFEEVMPARFFVKCDVLEVVSKISTRGGLQKFESN